MIVYAYDKNKNCFAHTVTFHDIDTDRPIINFYGPCEYYVKDLIDRYPFDKPYCIDMGGANHKGHGTGPVIIDAEQMNQVMEAYLTKILLLQTLENPSG